MFFASYCNTKRHIEKYMLKAEAIGSGNKTFLVSLRLIYCQLHEVSNVDIKTK